MQQKKIYIRIRRFSKELKPTVRNVNFYLQNFKAPHQISAQEKDCERVHHGGFQSLDSSTKTLIAYLFLNLGLLFL